MNLPVVDSSRPRFLVPRVVCFGLTWVLLAAVSEPAAAQSLRGSASSLDRQARQAKLHDYTYVRRAVQLKRLVSAGVLVPVQGNRNYVLHGVSFEVARPEVKLFIERLGSQYRRACGEALVVTSLTRPTSLQPVNASRRSVHPTGMAIDLRRSSNARCRRWLESTLIALEQRHILEATLERNPPHYHVALFPAEYLAYVGASRTPSASRSKPTSAVVARALEPEKLPLTTQTVPARRHTVQPHETMWSISRQYGMTVADLQAANGLTSNDIKIGQVLSTAVRR